MRTDLLESLRDALYKLPDDCPGFDLEYWANGKLPESPTLDCGTSACAIGLASTLPDWKEAGFRLTERTTGIFFPAPIIDEEEMDGDFNVVALFLGIEGYDAEFLFSPTEYEKGEDDRVNPHTVADRIQDFLKTA